MQRSSDSIGALTGALAARKSLGRYEIATMQTISISAAAGLISISPKCLRTPQGNGARRTAGSHRWVAPC